MPISHAHKTIEASDYINPISFDNFKDVVTKKQDMYNEGRSLIQKQIDAYSQIADSLPKPEQRAYFEQEMEKLGKAINDNAGLDFSVKANTQAVLNIGKPLERDPIIINGIESAKNINKMKEEYAKLDPSLKAPENDALFYGHINDWYTNGKIDEKLDYQPYKPYQKGVVDKYGSVIKELKPIVETVITQTPDGRWITTNKISSVDAKRVYDAYMGALTPAEQEQLVISARYKMNQTGKTSVAQEYLLGQKSTYKGIESKIKEEEAKYQLAKQKTSESDPDMIQFRNNLEELKMQRDVLAKKVSIRPDEVDESTLLNYLINDDILNTAGSLAYKEVESKMDHNVFALESFKTANNLQEYRAKKQMDLAYAMKAEELGLSTSEGKSKQKPFVGYTPMNAKDQKELEDATPVQTFTDMSSLSSEENARLNEGIASLGKLKLAADGVTLVSALEKDPKTGAERNTATVQDLLNIATNENNIYGHSKLDALFTGAGGRETKETLFWKLKGIAKALADAKAGQKAVWTVADNDGKEFQRQLSISEFLKEPADAVFTQMNDLYIKQ